MVWLLCVKHSLKPYTTRGLKGIKQLPEHWRGHGSHLEVTVILHQTDYVVINLSANTQQLQQQCAHCFLPLPSPNFVIPLKSQHSLSYTRKIPSLCCFFSASPEAPHCREQTGSSCAPAVRQRRALRSIQPGFPQHSCGAGHPPAQWHCSQSTYPEGRAAFPEHGGSQLGLQKCSQHVRMFTEQRSFGNASGCISVRENTDHKKEKETPCFKRFTPYVVQTSCICKNVLLSLILLNHRSQDAGNWRPIPQRWWLQSAFLSKGLKSDIIRAGPSLLL